MRAANSNFTSTVPRLLSSTRTQPIVLFSYSVPMFRCVFRFYVSLFSTEYSAVYFAAFQRTAQFVALIIRSVIKYY